MEILKGITDVLTGRKRKEKVKEPSVIEPTSTGEKTMGILKGTRRIATGTKEGVIQAPRFVWSSIGRILKFIFGIIVLALVIYFIIFMVVVVKTGTAETIGENVWVALENTWAGPIVEKIGLKAILLATKPETLITGEYGFEAQVDKNEENPYLGVHINKFSPKSRVFSSGENIIFTAEVAASSLAEDTVVRFNCKLKDYNDEDYGYGEAKIPSEGADNEISLPKNIKSQFYVTCEFPEGIIVEEKEITAKKAIIEAIYDFETNAYVKTYFLNKDKYDYFISNNINPFDYYGIKDRNHLKGDNTALPHYSDGPIKLSINSKQTQPLTKGIKYLLEVKIKNKQDYGMIDKLNSLVIELPDQIKLIEDSSCDFVSTGEKTETGLNIYRIIDGSNTLKRINRDCSLSALFGEDLSVEDCVNRYKSSATFQCWFTSADTLYSSDLGEGITFDFLRAKARYIYKTSKRSVANIEKAL
jgi:hypothetical protein